MTVRELMDGGAFPTPYLRIKTILDVTSVFCNLDGGYEWVKELLIGLV